MATKQDYLNKFSNRASAVEYENTCLSFASDPMLGTPQIVLDVIKGSAEPNGQYWDWLINCVEQQVEV